MNVSGKNTESSKFADYSSDVGPKNEPSHRVNWMAWLLGISLITYTLGHTVYPTQATDLFWQLRTGHDIVATGHAPHHDRYSWTRYGSPWVAHEWLTFVLLWGSYQLGHGFAGVWLLKCLLIGAIFASLFAFLLRETNGAPALSFFLAVYAEFLCQSGFEPRPQLVTYLFITTITGLVLAARRHKVLPAWVWGFIPLFALWANMHAGVVVGVGILAAFAVGDFLQSFFGTKGGDIDQAVMRRHGLLMGLLALCCGLATLATPYSWHEYENVGSTVSNATLLNRITEWVPPDFSGTNGTILGVLIAIIPLGVLCVRKRELSRILLAGGLLLAALSARRNICLFTLAGVLVAAGPIRLALISLSEVFGPARGGAGSPWGRRMRLALMGIIAVLLPGMSIASADQIVRASPETGGNTIEHIARVSMAYYQFPDAACRFLKSERFPTGMRLFNPFNYGGFLIFYAPQYPVFIDSRADLYFGRVLDEIVLDLGKLPNNWRDILAPYHPDLVVTSTEDNEHVLFANAPEWALVYADRPSLDPESDDPRINALIFVRRLPRYEALIGRCRRDCAAFPQLLQDEHYHGCPSLR